MGNENRRVSALGWSWWTMHCSISRLNSTSVLQETPVAGEEDASPANAARSLVVFHFWSMAMRLWSSSSCRRSCFFHPSITLLTLSNKSLRVDITRTMRSIKMKCDATKFNSRHHEDHETSTATMKAIGQQLSIIFPHPPNDLSSLSNVVVFESGNRNRK